MGPSLVTRPAESQTCRLPSPGQLLRISAPEEMGAGTSLFPPPLSLTPWPLLAPTSFLESPRFYSAVGRSVSV